MGGWTTPRSSARWSGLDVFLTGGGGGKVEKEYSPMSYRVGKSRTERVLGCSRSHRRYIGRERKDLSAS